MYHRGHFNEHDYPLMNSYYQSLCNHDFVRCIWLDFARAYLNVQMVNGKTMMHEQVRQQNWPAVDFLAREGASVETRDLSGFTVLQDTCYCAEMDSHRFRCRLHENNDDLECTTCVAYHQAEIVNSEHSRNHRHLAKIARTLILKYGADVNADMRENCVLLLTTFRQNFFLLQMFLFDNAIRPKFVRLQERLSACLSTSVAICNFRFTKKLLQAGASAHVCCVGAKKFLCEFHVAKKHCATFFLHWAVLHDNYPIAQFIVREIQRLPANVMKMRFFGALPRNSRRALQCVDGRRIEHTIGTRTEHLCNTALHVVKSRLVASLLYKAGANVHQKNSSGKNAVEHLKFVLYGDGNSYYRGDLARKRMRDAFNFLKEVCE